MPKYDRETFCVYFTACNNDENGNWCDEVELFGMERVFDTFLEAFRYINRWYNRPARELMARYDRSCLQISIDRNLWHDGRIDRSEPCKAGVYWLNGLYNIC